MEIMNHCLSDNNQRIIEILEASGIDYIPFGRNEIIFEMSSEHSSFAELKEITQELKILHSYYKFSDEEMEAAEWFTMRSTNNKLENVLEEKTFEYSCKFTRRIDVWAKVKTNGSLFVPEDVDFYGHEKQVAPYYFSKKIKWGRNFFYSVLKHGAEDYFCNDVAKNIITNNDLKGASFLPPIRKQTNEPMEDAYQFVVNNVLPESSCEVVGYRDIYYCPVCGKKEYAIDALARLCVNSSVLGDQDFYATEPIYTLSDKWTIPERFYIISHRAYEVFKASGFTRTLEIFPLLTV